MNLKTMFLRISKDNFSSQNSFFLFFLFFYGTFISAAQCPTTTNTNQSFCDIQAPTVADLQATDNGGGIAWYATATSTTALSPGLGLINGEDYFLDSSGGSCGNRIAVIVSLYTAPTGQNFQGICVSSPSQATIASLNATGNNVQWYNNPFGGTPLAPTSVIVSGNIYYAGQTNPITGCLTSRLPVSVVVNVVTEPVGESIQLFCNDPENPPTVGNLNATGNNNWYLTNTSALVLDPSTPLIDGHVYYGTTIVPPCESTQRLEVLVNILPENEAGEDGSFTLCETDLATAPDIDLFDSLLGTPSNLGVWTGPVATTNGNLGTIDVSSLTEAGSPYAFTYTVTTSPLCPPDVATVTIIIEPLVDAGEDGTAFFCGNDAPADLFSFLGGTPDQGGTWSPALASGTGLFDPTVDMSGNYIYTLPGTSFCPPASATVQVTVNEIPEAGENGSLTLCEADLATAPDINLFDSLLGTPSNLGVWTGPVATANGNLGTLDLSNLAESGSPYVFTYTVTTSPLCPPDIATVTITIEPLVDAGDDGSAFFCGDDAPADLFSFLEGTPELGGIWSPALASGTGIFDPLVDLPGAYVYTLPGTSFCPSASATVAVTVSEIPEAGENGSLTLCEADLATAPDINLFNSLLGTPSNLGVWTGSVPTTNGNLGTLDLSNLAESGSPYVFTYTVTTSPLCPPDISTVTIIIEPLVNAGSDGMAFFCGDDNAADLIAFLGSAPDFGGTWSPAMASGNGTFDPLIDSPGVYVYTLPGTSFCPPASSTVIVTVTEIPEAGEDGSFTLCEADLATAPDVNLFDSLSGTPSNLGIWTGPIPTTNGNLGTLDISNLTESGSPYIFTYTVSTSPSCPPDVATVTIVIEPLLDAGNDGIAFFCGDGAPADLITFLGGTPDLGGTWSPSLASGTGIFDPLVDLPGVYVYSFSGTSFCPPASSTVTVTVTEIPEAGEDGGFTLCEADLATAPDVNLLEILLGTPSNLGIWTGPVATANGNLGTLDLSNLTESGSPYIFTYTVSTSPSCPPDISTVTIIIEPLLDAGNDDIAVFCGDGAPEDLITFLGGTPDLGGTWSPALASGTGVFDPSVDLPGVYVYSFSATSFCPASSATVTVTVNEIPEAGENATAAFCEDDAATDLFSFLGGIPDLGGTWSPALTSGTGVFDPSVDLSGSYVYTVVGATGCSPASATIVVTVDELPTNTLADVTVDAVCLNSDATVLISNATNLTNGTYQLSYQISGAVVYNATVSVVFENGNTGFIIPATVLNTVGNYTLTISPISSNTANACGTSGHTFDALLFDIEDVATPIFSGSSVYCETDNATIFSLSSAIIGSQPIVWYDAPQNGIAYANDTLLLDGKTYYAAIVSDSGCESTTRLEVTVTVEDCEDEEPKLIIPDGFSPNGDEINDAFVIKNIRTLYPQFSITIYNRWGNVLFEGNASKPDWDGNSEKGMQVSGSKLPIGVYFYILNFNDGTRKPLQGRLYLSR